MSGCNCHTCHTECCIRKDTFPGNQANGFISIFYREVGLQFKNCGRNIVLIHGIGVTSKAFQCLMLSLYNCGYYVLALDRRGWGQSEKPDNVSQITLPLYATDIRELCAFLGAEHPILVGHDFGALIATQYYTQYSSDPIFSTCNIIYLAGAVDPILDPAFLAMAQDALASPESVVAFSQVFVEFALTPLCSEDLTALRIFLTSMSLQTTPLTLSTDFSLMISTDFSMVLPVILIPVLYIHGNNDMVVLLKTAYQNAALTPNADFIDIIGGSHVPMLDHYKLVSDGIDNFIKRTVDCCSLCNCENTLC